MADTVFDKSRAMGLLKQAKETGSMDQMKREIQDSDKSILDAPISREDAVKPLGFVEKPLAQEKKEEPVQLSIGSALEQTETATSVSAPTGGSALSRFKKGPPSVTTAPIQAASQSSKDLSTPVVNQVEPRKLVASLSSISGECQGQFEINSCEVKVSATNRKFLSFKVCDDKLKCDAFLYDEAEPIGSGTYDLEFSVKKKDGRDVLHVTSYSLKKISDPIKEVKDSMSELDFFEDELFGLTGCAGDEFPYNDESGIKLKRDHIVQLVNSFAPIYGMSKVQAKIAKVSSLSLLLGFQTCYKSGRATSGLYHYGMSSQVAIRFNELAAKHMLNDEDYQRCLHAVVSATNKAVAPKTIEALVTYSVMRQLELVALALGTKQVDTLLDSGFTARFRSIVQ